MQLLGKVLLQCLAKIATIAKITLKSEEGGGKELSSASFQVLAHMDTSTIGSFIFSHKIQCTFPHLLGSSEKQ